MHVSKSLQWEPTRVIVGLAVLTLFLLSMSVVTVAANMPGELCRDKIASNSSILSTNEVSVLERLCDQIQKNQLDIVLSSQSGTAQHTGHYAVVDFQNFEGALNTKDLRDDVVPENLQNHCQDFAHKMTGAFFDTMRAILKNQSSRPAIKLKGFTFDTSKSAISLSYVSNLRFAQSIFCGSVTIEDTQHTPDLSFFSTVILDRLGDWHLGGLDVRNAKLNDLQLESSVLAYVDGYRSTIAGNLSVIGSISSHFGFEGAKIAGSVFFTSFSALSNESMDAYFVIKNAGRRYIYGDYLNFNGAEIGSLFSVSLSQIFGELAMVEADVKEVSIGYSHVAALDLRRITTKRDLELSASRIGAQTNTTPLSCTTATKPTGDRSKRGVLLTEMNIGGSMRFIQQSSASAEAHDDLLRELKLEPRVVVTNDLCLNGSVVGANVDLSGVTGRRIIASDTRIGRQLILATDSSELNWLYPVPELSERVARLDLRLLSASSVKTKLAEEDWPTGTFVRGADIGFLFLETGAGKAIVSDEDLRDKIAAALSRQHFPDEGKVPYKFFEKFLTDIGAESEAARIAFLGEERETAMTEGPFYLFRWLKRWFGGYGIEPIYPAGTSVLFLFVGICFRLRFVCILSGPKAPWDAKRAARETVDAFFFSLDRLVPIFSISKRHGDEFFEYDAVTRWYFAIHAIAGWVLAVMLPLFLTRLLG